MNILPQKSWHVRRKENVEKVRRDEAEAEAKRLEQESRHSKAEAEALRARLGGSTSTSTVTIEKDGHVNLFWDRDFDNSEKNKADHIETEKKEETEKWARKVGISVGLNDKSEEAANHWLFGKKSSGDQLKMVEDLALHKKDLKRKSYEDPMNAFASKKSLDSTGKVDYSKSDFYCPELAYKALTSEQSTCQEKGPKRKTEKKRKNSKKKKHKTKKYSSDSESSEDKSGNSKQKKESKLDQLRKERLAREEKERKRAEELLKSRNIP